jgi:hypothetical protein
VRLHGECAEDGCESDKAKQKPLRPEPRHAILFPLDAAALGLVVFAIQTPDPCLPQHFARTIAITLSR